MNITAQKFSIEKNLLKEYNHWFLLYRNQQVTKGSMVLIVKGDYKAFSELSIEVLKELKYVYSDIEFKLKIFLGFEKINYLALMMMDPHVHYHIFPRYLDKLNDRFFPFPVDLSSSIEYSNELKNKLKNKLQ